MHTKNPEFIKLTMHELHDVPFASYPGFEKVKADINKLLYCAKEEKRLRQVHQDLSPLSSQQALSIGHLSTTSTDVST